VLFYRVLKKKKSSHRLSWLFAALAISFVRPGPTFAQATRGWMAEKTAAVIGGDAGRDVRSLEALLRRLRHIVPFREISSPFDLLAVDL
jgi:hypothetical protein